MFKFSYPVFRSCFLQILVLIDQINKYSQQLEVLLNIFWGEGIERVILIILVFKRGLYLTHNDVDVGVNVDAQSPCPQVARLGFFRWTSKQ